MKYIKFIKEVSSKDVALVGGKNASLGELYQKLVPKGIKVPNCFAITVEGYKHLLHSCNLEDKIKQKLEGVDFACVDELVDTCSQIRELFMNSSFPKDLEEEILKAYKQLCLEYGCADLDVAIRSSATAEDLPDASFAGQQDTYLNVRGDKEVLFYILSCFASLFTARAVSYRERNGFDHLSTGLSVGVQKMVRADIGASGVMFTCDTETGFDGAVFITASLGLGENVVGGSVEPDEFYVFKKTLQKGFRPIIKRQLGNKNVKMVYAPKGSLSPTINIPTSKEEMDQFAINDEDILTLAKYAIIIEEHYSSLAKRACPMDIEWAKDGQSNDLFIVQARPETVHSKNTSNNKILKYHLLEKNPKVLLQGKAIGSKIGSGKVCLLDNPSQMASFNKGDVLLTDNTDPDWEPIMKLASAIITNRGGRTCHAAIVAREIGVPTIVGAINATQILQNKLAITVDCSTGEDGLVYEGELDFVCKEHSFDENKRPKVKILANVANPAKAFAFAALPNDGVGLARMELIMINQVKAHPMALVSIQKNDFSKINATQLKQISELIRPYKDAKDFFISKITEGIGMICSAFYPKPVVVRFSDFKSNEYKNMLGGKAYEPTEENPMIGFRGASRYYSDSYKEAFAWECEGLAKVRSELGLKNMKVMIPFLRTPEEGKKVLAIMAKHGLIQHEDGLEVYIMCELPSNVLLADEFLKDFDGFSIGSNDLTQLTLGVDRDGELVSHIFDERHRVMQKTFKQAIDACKRAKKYCGICGQGPSDYPEVAQFLLDAGIDSMSLNPDCIVDMWGRLAGE